MDMVTNVFENRGTAMDMDTNFLKNRGMVMDMVTASNRCPPNSGIDYRENTYCQGVLALAFTIDPSVYDLSLGYQRCASRCLGMSGVVAFNWLLDTVGTCECLSSVQAKKSFFISKSL